MNQFIVTTALFLLAQHDLSERIDAFPASPLPLPDTQVIASGGADVDYAFRMGTYEVTNQEYVEFLNVAASPTDPRNLYHVRMSDEPEGGILRLQKSDGSWLYRVKPGFDDIPVIFVRWVSALRFINWLHHGKPTDALNNEVTETGAYQLEGSDEHIFFDLNKRENAARWFLPNYMEWKKAARWNPQVESYWRYATQSDEEPTPAMVDSLGRVLNPGSNVANFMKAANWNGSTNGNLTRVGRLESPSPFGTYDQTGNVLEWVEDRYEVIPGHLVARSLWGGSYAWLNGGAPPKMTVGIGVIGSNPPDDWMRGARMPIGGFRVAAHCFADRNFDHQVNHTDIQIFSSEVQQKMKSADLNGDQEVNAMDVQIFYQAYELNC